MERKEKQQSGNKNSRTAAVETAQWRKEAVQWRKDAEAAQWRKEKL